MAHRGGLYRQVAFERIISYGKPQTQRCVWGLFFYGAVAVKVVMGVVPRRGIAWRRDGLVLEPFAEYLEPVVMLMMRV